MANALELHRQLKENSKKNTVIDMADIQSITSKVRGQQNVAPLNTGSASANQLPNLNNARASAVATQDTTDNLVNSAVDNKKTELLANVAKFGALANTAFLPYQAGKEKRDSINNAYDTMMNNTQDKKYSGYSNEELADAYKNIPNYNIVERMFDPKKSAAYGVKQDLSQYAMADAYNKIIEQGGKFGDYNSLPSRIISRCFNRMMVPI